MCDDFCDEYSTTLASTWVNARKEHKCMACRETIRRGHRYHRHASVYDGSISVWRHCVRCWLMCEALWKAGAGYIDFELNCGETWEENYGALPPDVAALAFMSPDDAQAIRTGGKP